MTDRPAPDDMPDVTGPGDTDLVAQALGAWPPLAPPADFADRVMAARDAERPTMAMPPRRWRRAAVAIGVASAAAVAIVVLRPAHRAATGSLITHQRVTQPLGDRGLAVAEPDTELTWRIDDRGRADLTQRTGNVFYRVERGEPFVVHTPAGDVRVTGTCFRIEVAPMTPNTKLLVAGTAGAVLATAVLITVYEGRVIAETRAAHTELTAGGSATLGADGAALVAGSPAARAALPVAFDAAHASRDQLLQRTQQQDAQLATLRGQVAALEQAARPPDSGSEPGRLWHDPSPAQLTAWVAECHVRSDEPSLEQYSPASDTAHIPTLQASELDAYNASLGEMASQWKAQVRRLYIEVTGDAAGADSLSTQAMRQEIEDKSPATEHNQILQRLAQERAGLAAPPADLSKTSPLEQLTRAYTALGDQTEAAVAKRLGPARAHAIRGEGWGGRSDMAGCP